MAYEHIVAAANDPDLLNRIAAAAAAENYTGDPVAWASERRWDFAAEPGWSDAYHAGIQGHIDRPGLRPAVITDGMILAAVQAKLAP